MPYTFIQKLYNNVHNKTVHIEGCSKPFSAVMNGMFLLFNDKPINNNKLGLKMHVRINDNDIHEALKIIAQTTQKHSIGCFKVASAPFNTQSKQHCKQFTIYVDERKMNSSVLNAFVNDLEKKLSQANIQPNIVGQNMSIGDKLIPNSDYISYRYDQSDYIISTPKQLFEFLNKNKIPYSVNDIENPKFVTLDTNIVKRLLEQEYLVRTNYAQNNAPIILPKLNNQCDINLKYLTNIRPSDYPYKSPHQKDIMSNIEVGATKKKNISPQSCVLYTQTGYCEIFTNPKQTQQDIQKIQSILEKNDIPYVTVRQSDAYIIRLRYNTETAVCLKDNKLIDSIYYSEKDNTRNFILDIINTAQITQYASTGRFVLKIPPEYSEIRNEMFEILTQQGVTPQKLKIDGTYQYYLSFPRDQKSIQFVNSLKKIKINIIPIDPLKKTGCRTLN